MKLKLFVLFGTSCAIMYHVKRAKAKSRRSPIQIRHGLTPKRERPDEGRSCTLVGI